MNKNRLRFTVIISSLLLFLIAAGIVYKLDVLLFKDQGNDDAHGSSYGSLSLLSEHIVEDSSIEYGESTIYGDIIEQKVLYSGDPSDFTEPATLSEADALGMSVFNNYFKSLEIDESCVALKLEVYGNIPNSDELQLISTSVSHVVYKDQFGNLKRNEMLFS